MINLKISQYRATQQQQQQQQQKKMNITIGEDMLFSVFTVAYGITIIHDAFTVDVHLNGIKTIVAFAGLSTLALGTVCASLFNSVTTGSQARIVLYSFASYLVFTRFMMSAF